MNQLTLDLQSPSAPSYRKISLTQGQFAIVDAEDYDYLMQWDWFAWYSPWGYYAKRRIIDGRGRRNILPMTNALYGLPNGPVVDHANRNSLDNRRQNLRSVSRIQNLQNKSAYRNNTSGARGVVWNKRQKCWRAQITIDGANQVLGIFTTLASAELAFREAFERKRIGKDKSMIIQLEDIMEINGFTVKLRRGASIRVERIPRYTVWHGDHCLEEFRRLSSALKWAGENTLSSAIRDRRTRKRSGTKQL